MNPIDNLIFSIALVKLDLEFQLFSQNPSIFFDVCERFVAVNLRLTLAEQVEVWSVQYIDEPAHLMLQAVKNIADSRARTTRRIPCLLESSKAHLQCQRAIPVRELYICAATMTEASQPTPSPFKSMTAELFAAKITWFIRRLSDIQ